MWPGDSAPETAAFWGAIIAALARRRKALGLTQEVANERLGVAQALLGKWETGARRPTAHLFALWAATLGGRLIFVLDDGTEPADQRDRALVEIAAIRTDAEEQVARAERLIRRARRRDEDSRRRAAELDRAERAFNAERQRAVVALGGDTGPRLLTVRTLPPEAR